MEKLMYRYTGFLFFVVLFSFSTAQGAPQPLSTPIVLGQSCALSGPAQNLGLEMRAGLLAAFSSINDAGGIHGREIILLSRDDGYEPDEAVRNTKASDLRRSGFCSYRCGWYADLQGGCADCQRRENPFFWSLYRS